MSETGSDRTTGPTRRQYLVSGGAVVAGGLLAGCTSSKSPDETTGTAMSGPDSSVKPYTATISPVGEVTFDGVPERVFTVFPQYLDMAVALGHGDAVNAVYVPEMSGTTMNHYYHHLDGVSLDWEGLHDPLADGLSKELLYELDSDVHLADPTWVATQDSWTESDVSEVATQLAPWFGNFYSGTQAAPPSGADEYEYYTLWELFERMAAVFDERERYEALEQVHADLVSHIQENLPPKVERPTAVRATLSADGTKFWTYHLNEPGYWLADTRPLGANDAFESADWGGLWGTVDYEAMLEADPDVILHLWGLTPSYSMSETRATLSNDPAGKQLRAVKNDRVYAAGMRYQGPIMNLFQLEMGAKQLYPDVFGPWPGYEDGDHYPEIQEDEHLFDRQRVADIVTGEF
ncbi:ABC transporter substrate-binding protein [Haladaptatus sp. DYSN1]|uniref:ABC transporter substrate-binding protein n=1 Tax=unclassified Haladaptatus TaxID=2622732 RepID=UPI0024060266|nr:ABC transporter substrate-binding protein [Haladaptatus sp. DYSN1]